MNPQLSADNTNKIGGRRVLVRPLFLMLGLVLAARAARLERNESVAKGFDRRLLDALSAELATRNEDYENHRAEIDRAVDDARRPD